MATKPQRKRRTRSQRQEDGREMAKAVTTLVGAAVGTERRRNRLHFAALWVAVICAALLGIWF